MYNDVRYVYGMMVCRWLVHPWHADSNRSKNHNSTVLVNQYVLRNFGFEKNVSIYKYMHWLSAYLPATLPRAFQK